MCVNEIKLNTIYTKKDGSKVCLLDTFDNINCKFDDVVIKTSSSLESLQITLSSDVKNCDELDKMFLLLYNYIGILMGYFPKIAFASNINIDKLIKIYDTSDKYIIAQTSFIKKLDNNTFIKSFKKYIEIYNNVNFQINHYFYSICSLNDNYPEFPTVNILQSLDGIYDLLTTFKNNLNIIDDKKKIKEVKNRISSIDFSDVLNEDEVENIKIAIRNNILRLEKITYETKLKNIFDFINDKYKLFELECNNNCYDSFISKCKHTRNKFSHSIDKNNVFNGEECVFYLYKLSLLFRLLIVEEIGLSENINYDLLNYEIIITDDRLKLILGI